MPGLEEHRRRIDEIDNEILRLIEERVNIAKKIGKEKKKLGKDIPDLGREKQVLDKITESTELNRGFIRSIFEQVIRYCRNEQN
ncbi:MAG: chorismate mutase [Candidatus Altiarchaeota archaeon]|nr:chorismate mutase [Candidatus Altiarchaeota archaeon]